jgi:hypothetical protein
MPTSLLVVTLAALVGLRLGVDPLVAEAVALAASALAAWAFARGDPPRLPWALRTVAIGLVFAAHVIQRLDVGGPAGLVLLLVANPLGAAAMLGFLHVVRRSGLAAPMTRPAAVGLAALALAAAGVVAVILVHLAPAPDLRAAAIVVSTLCDALGFVGAALLLRMVLPLRGGTIAQPYLLLALDGLCFLLADLGHALGGGVAAALPWFAAAGWSAGATAGLAQAELLRRASR